MPPSACSSRVSSATAGVGSTPAQESVATGASDARNNGRFQHVAAFARVLAEHDGLAHECNGSLSQAVCEFARQIDMFATLRTPSVPKSRAMK